jgi:hypothetical protein
MFKLLRLAIYALVGYAAYQFVMDVLESAHQGQDSTGGGRVGAARTSGARRGGGGKTESTEDADGASARRRVGRGVI